MRRVAHFFLAALAAGCGGSPTAPDRLDTRPAVSADVATISGRVYAGVGPDYTPIVDGIVEVREADGFVVTTATDASGFYRISAKRGSVTISASKEGYEAKQWQFDLSNDTVLNFSLDPE